MTDTRLDEARLLEEWDAAAYARSAKTSREREAWREGFRTALALINDRARAAERVAVQPPAPRPADALPASNTWAEAVQMIRDAVVYYEARGIDCYAEKDWLAHFDAGTLEGQPPAPDRLDRENAEAWVEMNWPWIEGPERGAARDAFASGLSAGRASVSAPPRPAGEGRESWYLPMNCPNCDRVRVLVYPAERRIRCEKCEATSFYTDPEEAEAAAAASPAPPAEEG